MKQILALFLLLLISQNIAFSASPEANLAILEKQVLGNTYSQDKPEQRLSRLEENVFGIVSAGSIESRLQKLNKTFEFPKADIPESFKEEIEKAEEENINKNSVQKPEQTEQRVQILANSSEIADTMLKVINQERSFRSLRTLNKNAIADRMALEQASYLIQTKQFSHYGLSGKNPDQRYTEAGGNGKVEEIIDGFFAQTMPNGDIVPISLSQKTAEQLMDALLDVPDKKDMLLNQDANAIGISFVLSQDKKQLAIVLEVLADYTSFASIIPPKSPPASFSISGVLDSYYKFAWIGIAKRDLGEDIEKVELEPSPYFPPIDKIIYIDRSIEKAKSIAKTGGMILAMIAAPFTYGASLLIADILMQSVAQTYQAQDVEMREGIKAGENSFSGNINIGEWGAGTYYISIWAYPSGAQKPVIISRRTVRVS